MNELLSGRFRLLNLPPRKRRTADSLGLQSRQFRNAIPSPPQRVLFAAGARFLLGKIALALTARSRRHCPLRRHRTGFFGQRFRYQWRGIFTTSASATAALGSGNGGGAAAKTVVVMELLAGYRCRLLRCALLFWRRGRRRYAATRPGFVIQMN